MKKLFFLIERMTNPLWDDQTLKYKFTSHTYLSIT